MTSWKEEARRRLAGRPEAQLLLADLIPPAALPSWPCTLPWRRLEMSTRRLTGPCCPDYQVEPARAPAIPDVAELWNGEAMRAFRRALTGAPHTTCRASCPTLAGGAERPARFRVRGGSGRFVDRQLRAAEQMLAGQEVCDDGPLDLMFPPTTYCNYDCLMCEWGEEGTLEDELPESFYDSLEPLLPGLRTIDVAGGEPLASRTFREFLSTLDRDRWPDLRISLVTNGSYLAPGELDKLAHVPFDTITISLNAATPETYAAVNRGLPFHRVRANLDSMLARRADGRLRGDLIYSMVLLRENHHEVRAFAELARRDGVRVRFMLPMFDRNEQSIMTGAEPMRASLDQLDAVVRQLRDLGREHEARVVAGEAEVLRARLAAGIASPLPDGRSAPDVPLPLRARS